MSNRVEKKGGDIDVSDHMFSSYDALIDLLRKEVDLYDELCTSFESEHSILLKFSIDALHENNIQKERLIAKAQTLNHDRTNLVNDIVSTLDLSESNISLSTLINYADECQEGRLREYRSHLRELSNKIIALNERNKKLLESSLYYVQKSRDFLREIISPSPVYKETGMIRVETTNGQIVSQVG